MSDAFYLVLGDLLPEQFYRLSPPTDLTTATGVTFSVWDRDGVPVLTDAPAVIANGDYVVDGVPMTFAPVDGVVIWPPQTGQITARGVYQARFRIAFPGPKHVSHPNYDFLSLIVS